MSQWGAEKTIGSLRVLPEVTTRAFDPVSEGSLIGGLVLLDIAGDREAGYLAFRELKAKWVGAPYAEWLALPVV